MDGVFRIARRVAKNRVISTVDPETRTDTRPPRGVSTATRATSRSTRIQRSSPPPRSPRAMSATPSPLLICWPRSCPPIPTPTRVRATPAARIAGRSTAMRPTAPASCWSGWKPRARRSSRRCSRPSPESGTQDRAFDAPPTRWAPRQGAWHHEGRRRLFLARCRGQPGPPRCARSAPSHRPRAAAHARMTTQHAAAQQLSSPNR